MRHSLWVTHSGVTTPGSTDDPTHDAQNSQNPQTPPAPPAPPARPARQSPDDPALTPVRTSTRVWMRSLLAFLALVLLLAALIELVAYLVIGGSLTMPFGVAAAAVSIAIIATLAVTRERQR